MAMNKLKKTTIRLKQELKEKARKSAEQREMSFQELVNQALLSYLNEQGSEEELPDQKIELKSFNVGVKEIPSRKELYLEQEKAQNSSVK